MNAASAQASRNGRAARNRAASFPFIVFSDDWGEHPSSSQHLFAQLVADHPILWVNTIGMRRPTLSVTDIRKILLKAGRMLGAQPRQKAQARAVEGIRVCQPFMLPYSDLSFVRRLNARSVSRSVNRAAAEIGMPSPVVVTTVPNACDYVSTLRDELVVYYCVDDFTLWPGLDADLVRSMEEQLIGRADVLIATSQSLFNRLRSSGKPTHLLTHGVDFGLFASAAPTEHPVLAGLGRPRAGYFGLIDDRLDQSLLAALATRMPEVTFVFTGSVETDVSRLSVLSNVRFTGRVAYGELPALVEGLDVLLLPYEVNELGDTLQPLKLKEYLVTGRPVVSSPIAEARRMGELLTLAATTDEWQAALRASFKENRETRKLEMARHLRSESWESKAEQLLGFCGEARAQPDVARVASAAPARLPSG